MNMKLKFFIAGMAIVAGLASAVSCQDLSKDLTALQNKVTSLESTVQSLQAKIDAGAVITSVTPSNSGIKITLSNGNSYEITNGVNGKDGTNGKDGKDGKDGTPGSVVTIGENGNWFIDGVDTGMAAAGKNGTPGEYYVPNSETGCFDKYVWVEENGVGAYVKEATEISFLAPGTITAVYDSENNCVVLYGVKDWIGGYVIGGTASNVATIELYNYAKAGAEEFVTVTVGADAVFGEGLPGAIEFTKSEQVQRPTASITVKVDPANYVLQPEDVALVDSEGNIFDQVVAKVKKHEGLITKATTETGLWDVTFELSKFDETAFKAAVLKTPSAGYTAGNYKAFAFKAGESVTDFKVGFKMGTYTAVGTMAANFALDKDAQLINTYHNRATETLAVPEYEWTAGPKYTVIEPGKSGANVATGDKRNTVKKLYEAQVGKEIKVYVPKANKPEEVKAMYVTLDIKNAYGAGGGDVSEKNAWESYSYTGLNTVVEGSELTFSIDSPGALGDEIGFRVFAVNWDGTQMDPDGTAFYVLVGNGGSEWTTIATTMSKEAEYVAVQTSDVEIELPALPAPKGKYLLDFVNDDATATSLEFCVGINGGSMPIFKHNETPSYDLKAGGFDLTKKAKYKFFAYPSVKGGYVKEAKNNLYLYEDNKPYSGTITITDDGTDIVVATVKVTFTKVLPTAVPEGFSVKTGQLQDNVYNCYLVPSVATANVYATMAAYEAAVKAGTAAAAATGSMDMFNVFNFPGDDATNFNVSIVNSKYNGTTKKYSDPLELKTMGPKAVPAPNTITVDAALVDNTTAHATTVSYNYGSISHDACEWNKNGTVKTIKDYTKTLATFNTVYNCVYNSGYKWAWNWGKNTKTTYAYQTVFTAELAATPAQVLSPEAPAENETPQIVYEEFAKSANGFTLANIDGTSGWDSKYSGNLDALDGGNIAIIAATLTSDSNGIEEYFTDKGPVKSTDTNILFAAQSGASNPVTPVASTLTVYCNDVYGHLVPVKLPVKVMPRK